MARSRQAGLGLNPLTLSDIWTYVKMFEVEDTRSFVYLIQQMDEEFLIFHKPKDAPPSKSGNKK